MKSFATLALLAAFVACALAEGPASLRGAAPLAVRWSASPVSNCGSPSDHLHNLNVTLTPDPPVKGQNVSVIASGTLDEEITGGEVAITVTVLGIPVINEKKALCNDFKEVVCPIPSGPWTLRITELLPSWIPSGTYELKGVISDQNSQEVACISAQLNI